MSEINRNSQRGKKLNPYVCAICHKRFPSPESASAHLDKRHDGHGWVQWHNAAHIATGGRP